jgi:hypothetical protein
LGDWRSRASILIEEGSTTIGVCREAIKDKCLEIPRRNLIAEDIVWPCMKVQEFPAYYFYFLGNFQLKK